MKKFFAAICLLASLASAPLSLRGQSLPAVGEWRQFNTFDAYVERIFETPSHVYLYSQDHMVQSWADGFTVAHGSLFAYDKATQEITPYNAGNYLHGKSIQNVFYNAAKRYLLIVYIDSNIDIFYEQTEECYNVPGLASVVIPTGKKVYSASFDNEKNCAYLATDFGYIVVDDKRHLISESHNYAKKLNQICRVGDTLVAATDEGLFYSPLSAPDKHGTWNSFKKFENSPETAAWVIPMGNDEMAYASGKLYKSASVSSGAVAASPEAISGSNVTYIQEARDGYFIATEWEGLLLGKDGSKHNLSGTNSYNGATANANVRYAAYTPDGIWVGMSRKGLQQLTYDSEGNLSAVINPTHGEWIVPNTPSAFPVFHFSYSPNHGMVAFNSTLNRVFTNRGMAYGSRIDSYSDGLWSHHGSAFYDDSDPFKGTASNVSGGVVDPADPDALWLGTFAHGLICHNVAQNTTSMFTHPSDSYASKSGAYKVFPTSSGWKEYCNVRSPAFDSDGTLWAIHSTEWLSGTPNVLYYWTKADRLAGNASEFKGIPVPGFPSWQENFSLPLCVEANKNKIVLLGGTYAPGLWVLDHKGTLADTSDDQVTGILTLTDQDGATVNAIYLYTAAEDPATGRVWVGSSNGLYYFNPAEITNPDFHVYRVKVARNDGTTLADYLLEGSTVTGIAFDAAGHKWFSTLENGVFETSATGAEILNHFTTDNSLLPSNNVYSVGVDPSSNAIWFGTEAGLAQYFSPSSPAAQNLDNVVAFPNPVRPDYYGYLTIQGLMDGSLVKILDAAGNLVAELGLSEGGMMQWDLKNLSGRRVPTGVYYVACSCAADSGSESTVAKILVLN